MSAAKGNSLILTVGFPSVTIHCESRNSRFKEVRMSQIFKTALLLGILTVLLIVIGGAIGGQSGMLMAFILALAMNFASYWFSDRIVLAMYRAREVTETEAPDLYRIVRGLTQRAHLPLPRVYIIPSEAPNAFATGRNPEHAAVAVTEGILKILTAEELTGVLAHELGHVTNRDILVSTIAATLAGAVTYLAHMAQWAAIFGGRRDDDEEGTSPFVMIAMAILAPIAALLVQLAVSRSREYLADETGARLTREPECLARALEKLHVGAQMVPMQANPSTAHLFIVNPLTGGALMALFSTHPPIEDRIARLRQMRP